MRRYKAFIPLLAILSAMALMFSVIGGAYGPSLDRHFGYGRISTKSVDDNRSGLYYETPFDVETVTRRCWITRTASAKRLLMRALFC